MDSSAERTIISRVLLCDVLGEVVSKGSVPDVWMKSFIVPIFKGGEQELPGYYRGIALGSCVAKVMARVICEQLGEFAEDMVLTEEQGGFRANRGCSDQILALQSICEARKEQKKSTYLALVKRCGGRGYGRKREGMELE